MRVWDNLSEAELEEFEPRLKFERRLKYGRFHLKLYTMFQDLRRTQLKFIKFGLRAENFRMVDIGINAWSSLLDNLKINIIVQDYLKSVWKTIKFKLILNHLSNCSSQSEKSGQPMREQKYSHWRKQFFSFKLFIETIKVQIWENCVIMIKKNTRIFIYIYTYRFHPVGKWFKSRCYDTTIETRLKLHSNAWAYFGWAVKLQDMVYSLNALFFDFTSLTNL